MNQITQKENKTELIYKEESYLIIGACMEVHKELGRGFNEIVYKDALEYEFKQRKIPYNTRREGDGEGFLINYKEIILPRQFISDFIMFGKIILEIKAVDELISSFRRQTLNYMKITKYKLGIIGNFGEDSFKYQRLVL